MSEQLDPRIARLSRLIVLVAVPLIGVGVGAPGCAGPQRDSGPSGAARGKLVEGADDAPAPQIVHIKQPAADDDDDPEIDLPVVVLPTAPTVTNLLPDTIDITLGNGMRVFLVPDSEVPLIGFEVRVAGGSVTDAPGKEGTAALLATLLTRGAGDRGAVQFNEDVDFVGGSFGAAAGRRWITVSGQFLSQDTALALDLLADVLRRPRLEADEFEQRRGLAIDAVRADRDDPGSIIGRYWTAWQFAGHPLGRPVSGDERSLDALALEDIRRAAAASLAPSNCWLAVAGDFDPLVLRAALEARFGDWDKQGVAPPVLPPVPDRSGSARVLRVDKPDALQTYFRFGGAGIDWSHPDYPARHLANTLLGGRFTSRLNTALRIRSGLTYGAGSWFDDEAGGAFTVSSYTQTATSQQCLDLARSVYATFIADGISQAELDSARSYVKGQFAPDRLETASQVASTILALEFDRLPRETIGSLFVRLDALTLVDVNRVIKAHFPSAGLDWAVIGQSSTVDAFLSGYGEPTQIELSSPGFGPGY